jgi:hypothetical protein
MHLLKAGHWRRERNDGLYQSLTYLVAKLIEEVMIALLQSLVMSCIVFFPLELAGSWVLFWYTFFQTTCIGICEARLPHSNILSAVWP